jgi:hypothetical protein
VHPIDFFLKLGFYCERKFLDSRTLTGLFERFQQALPEPARVFDGGPDAVVDMAVRNTWQLSLDEVANDINGRIDALRDDVARHFAVPTFYGVVDDPAWRSFGVALAPEPGLLVAFPSHVVHEVTPVTAGDRYTIVDWFTG